MCLIFAKVKISDKKVTVYELFDHPSYMYFILMEVLI